MSLKDQSRPPNLFETAFFAGVEKAVNAALRRDPATLQRLADHAGQLVGVHLTLPPVSAWVLIVEDGIELYHSSDADPDLSMKGSPVDLAAQLFGWRNAPSVIGGPVQIRGDEALLRRLIDIARDLDIDWGGLFEPLMGTELAQQVDYSARRLFSWGRDMLGRLSEQLGEYMRDESGLLALRRDVYEFNQDVDELRMDLDRLDARVQRLKTKAEAR